ncbi:MAG: putative membrane protein YfcA [Rhodothermales bacterium]|jgi:uncharacterized membrane protein YfcA
MPQLPISLEMLALASLIVFVGAMVQGSIGFGLGTLGVPLLLLIHPPFVPAPMLLLAFVLTVTVFLKERRSVSGFEIGWGVVGRLIGAFLGALLVGLVSQDSLTLIAAGLVFVALALVQSGLSVPITRLNLVAAGTLSGFMGTTSSIGGPPMGLMYAGQKGPRVRGTLSGIFVAGTLSALFALWTVGKFGVEEVKLCALLLPAVLLGIVASRYTAKYLDSGFLKPAIMLVSGAAASIILVRHFF